MTSMRTAIEKEILHYDIFFALDRAGLLNELVFQGGTSLRLCRGSNRLSEDIDFAGGNSFCSTDFVEIKNCIESYIDSKYGLLVSVKEPKDLKSSTITGDISVSKWQVSIQTSPERTDIPRQKIKIEIANIPAYTRDVMALTVNYDFLNGISMPIVNVETIEEVLADKIIAFPASTKYIRYRDIWDLAWLSQQGAKLEDRLIINKIEDYKVDNYLDLLDQSISNLPSIIDSQEFINQMSRFIDIETLQKTLYREGFKLYLKNTVGNLLVQTKKKLSSDHNDVQEFEFKM